MKFKNYLLIAIVFFSFSTIVAQQEKTNYSLPSSNNELKRYDSIYVWELDTLNKKWVLYEKSVELTYDVNNNLTDKIRKTLENNSWINDYRVTNSYDANNNHLNVTESSWNGSAWDYKYRIEYTYDSKNNQLSETKQSWDVSAWKNLSHYLYTYDSNNNKTLQVYEDASGTGWKNPTQTTYTYDANNNLTKDVAQFWDASLSIWKNSNQRLYTYNSDNKQLTMLTQNWNEASSAWVDNAIVTNDYLNGSLISKHAQTYAGTSLVEYSLTLYTYDGNNNLTSETFQKPASGKWINWYNIKYTYDSGDYMNYSVSKNYDKAGEKIISSDSTVYFHGMSTGILSLATDNNELNIYPNPSTGKFTVELQQAVMINVEVYNLTGQKILQQKSGAIDMSTFPKGVYFVSTVSDKQAYTKRIVIE